MVQTFASSSGWQFAALTHEFASGSTRFAATQARSCDAKARTADSRRIVWQMKKQRTLNIFLARVFPTCILNGSCQHLTSSWLMTSSTPRIAIVGGGLGGTTAAILLQQAGY